MIAGALALVVLALQAQPAPRPSSPAATIAAQDSKAIVTTPISKANNTPSDDDLDGKLLRVKRIYVDNFGDDLISKQIQAMVINSLSESKRFIITENKEKADAVLKGTALEKTSQEFHGTSEGTGVASAAGGHHGSVSGSFVNGSGTLSGSSSGSFAAQAARIDDSVATTETINDARVAVRLVDKDGDVIWTSSQESTGAKYKGASADVADQVVKKLLRDLEKLQKKAAGGGLGQL